MTMTAKTISRKSLVENLLPEIIVQRTLSQLPLELKDLYLAKQAEGVEVSIGLDMQLGFYMLAQANLFQADLLWCENQSREVVAA
ncbi:hypothetical protein [uncultured Microscilla sp.]|uniref:hypothetical protein n=1 Tax=uncultured Microscilla sp. TaxID=432653 RepID=UPI002609DE9C|nr:hypothetical protein [uncultured Microscilla sp.]